MGPPASGTAQRRGLGKGIFGVPGLWELQPGTIQAVGRGSFLERNCWSVSGDIPQGMEMPGWHLSGGSGSGPGFQCRASLARHSGWRRRDRRAPGARGRTGPTFPSSPSCSDRSRAEMSKAQASSNLRAHSFSAGESAEGPAWRWLPLSQPGSRLRRPAPGAEPSPRPCKLPKTFFPHPPSSIKPTLKGRLALKLRAPIMCLV